VSAGVCSISSQVTPHCILTFLSLTVIPILWILILSGHRPAFCRLWLLDDNKIHSDTQHNYLFGRRGALCSGLWTAVHTQELIRTSALLNTQGEASASYVARCVTSTGHVCAESLLRERTQSCITT
jgi:hypothetical protein